MTDEGLAASGVLKAMFSSFLRSLASAAPLVTAAWIAFTFLSGRGEFLTVMATFVFALIASFATARAYVASFEAMSGVKLPFQPSAGFGLALGAAFSSAGLTLFTVTVLLALAFGHSATPAAHALMSSSAACLAAAAGAWSVLRVARDRDFVPSGRTALLLAVSMLAAVPWIVFSMSVTVAVRGQGAFEVIGTLVFLYAFVLPGHLAGTVAGARFRGFRTADRQA